MNNEYFVYTLTDPNTNDIFYVGKGKNYRDRSHLKPSLWREPRKTTNPFLYFKIRSLMKANTPPIVNRIYTNLSHGEASNIEVELIIKYGRRFVDGGKLFNLLDTPSSYNSGRKIIWTKERRDRFREINKQKRIYDPTYDELYKLYILQGKTRIEIAKINNCSEILVKKRLKELDIKKPKSIRYPKKNEFDCIVCGKLIIVANSVKRKYCSKECYDKKRSNRISDK